MLIYLLLGLAFILIFVVVDYRKFLGKRNKVFNSFAYVKTKYGNIRYLDLGNADGEVILISYGGGTGIDFIYSLDWLLDAGYRIIAVNRPGYYDLPVEVVDSIEGHADIYHEVIKHLGINKVHMFGLSMGGLAALYYAQKYEVSSLVLWSAITGKYTVNQESINSPLGRLIMSDQGKALLSWAMARSARWFPAATVRSFVETEAYLDKETIRSIATTVASDPVEKTRMIQFVESLTPMNKIYAGMMDEVEKAGQKDNILWQEITMPILAVASKVDKDVSIEHIARIASKLKHAQVKYVQAAGHFVWWGEEGKEIIDDTLKFFKNH